MFLLQTCSIALCALTVSNKTRGAEIVMQYMHTHSLVMTNHFTSALNIYSLSRYTTDSDIHVLHSVTPCILCALTPTNYRRRCNGIFTSKTKSQLLHLSGFHCSIKNLSTKRQNEPRLVSLALSTSSSLYLMIGVTFISSSSYEYASSSDPCASSNRGITPIRLVFIASK